MATWKAIEERTDTVVAAHRAAVDTIYMSNGKFSNEVVISLDRLYKETSRQLRELKSDCLRRIENVDEWSSKGRAKTDDDEFDLGDGEFDLSEARAALVNHLEAIDLELDATIGLKAALRRMIVVEGNRARSMKINTFEKKLLESLHEVHKIGAISQLAFERAEAQIGLPALNAAA